MNVNHGIARTESHQDTSALVTESSQATQLIANPMRGSLSAETPNALSTCTQHVIYGSPGEETAAGVTINGGSDSLTEHDFHSFKALQPGSFGCSAKQRLRQTGRSARSPGLTGPAFKREGPIPTRARPDDSRGQARTCAQHNCHGVSADRTADQPAPFGRRRRAIASATRVITIRGPSPNRS